MEKSNKCIRCNVRSCKNIAVIEDYCTLEQIQVGTREQHPTQVACTDCQSFEKK